MGKIVLPLNFYVREIGENMFADLKNDYKDISTAEYSKWIEN